VLGAIRYHLARALTARTPETLSAATRIVRRADVVIITGILVIDVLAPGERVTLVGRTDIAVVAIQLISSPTYAGLALIPGGTGVAIRAVRAVFRRPCDAFLVNTEGDLARATDR
jgi:hypothetical protein